MPNFKYKALSAGGVIQEGNISAEDKKTAIRQLTQKSLNVISVKSLDVEDNEVDKSSEATKQSVNGGQTVALAFFRKLHQLCKSGTSVGDALKGLSQRSLNKNLKALSKELYKSLSEGKSLSQALAIYPKIFEKSICHLVEAGENTANLVSVFQNIIDYLEGRRILRKKVISALVYPSVLFSVAFLVVLLFLFVLLPQIENMMKSLGGEMNLPVKILINLGEFLINYGPFILVGLVVGIIVLVKVRQTKNGLLATDKFLLKMPIMGKIVLDSDICRISNLLSTLFESGVNMTEALRLVEKSIKNTDIQQRFALCKIAINDGAQVSLAFKKYGILSDDDIDVISVGDKIGNLVDGFKEVNLLHFDTLSQRINSAIVMLSTVALLCAFTLVFFVALGIVSAVLSLSQNLIS